MVYRTVYVLLPSSSSLPRVMVWCTYPRRAFVLSEIFSIEVSEKSRNLPHVRNPNLAAIHGGNSWRQSLFRDTNTFSDFPLFFFDLLVFRLRRIVLYDIIILCRS